MIHGDVPARNEKMECEDGEEDLSRPKKRSRQSSYELMDWICNVCGHENSGVDLNCGLCWQAKNNAVLHDLAARLSHDEDSLSSVLDIQGSGVQDSDETKRCSPPPLDSLALEPTLTPSKSKRRDSKSSRMHTQSKGYQAVRLLLNYSRDMLSCVDRARLRCVALVDRDQDDHDLSLIARCVSLDESPSNAAILMKLRVAKLLDLGYEIQHGMRKILTLRTPKERIAFVSNHKKWMKDFEQVLPPLAVRRASLVFLVHDRFVVDLAFEYRTRGVHLARTLFSACGVALSHAPERFRDEKSVVLAAVEHTGLTLQIVSDRLRDDFDVVLTAVKNDGHALRYASENLCNNRDVVMAAVR